MRHATVISRCYFSVYAGFPLRSAPSTRFSYLFFKRKMTLRQTIKIITNLVDLQSVSKFNFRSTSSRLLVPFKHITKKKMDDRSFAVAAPLLWNSLSPELRTISELRCSSYYDFIPNLDISIVLLLLCLHFYSHYCIYLYFKHCNAPIYNYLKSAQLN